MFFSWWKLFEEIDNLIKILENNQQPVGEVLECMFERAIKGKYSKIIKNKIFSNEKWWWISYWWTLMYHN